MFIVLEVHGGPEHAIVVTNEDGSNKVFDIRHHAEVEAAYNCQDGIVVEV